MYFSQDSSNCSNRINCTNEVYVPFHRIVQGADWHYGPSKEMDITVTPPYIKVTAKVTAAICFMFFVAYLVYLVSLSGVCIGFIVNVLL